MCISIKTSHQQATFFSQFQQIPTGNNYCWSSTLALRFRKIVNISCAEQTAKIGVQTSSSIMPPSISELVGCNQDQVSSFCFTVIFGIGSSRSHGRVVAKLFICEHSSSSFLLRFSRFAPEHYVQPSHDEDSAERAAEAGKEQSEGEGAASDASREHELRARTSRGARSRRGRLS